MDTLNVIPYVAIAISVVFILLIYFSRKWETEERKERYAIHLVAYYGGKHILSDGEKNKEKI
jgi:hypothetical protein